jgi:hypothetical protein
VEAAKKLTALLGMQDAVTIQQFIERGDLSVHIARVLPLAAARHAHEILEGRLPKRPGKIVLKVAA